MGARSTGNRRGVTAPRRSLSDRRAPGSCKVKSARAYFHDPKGEKRAAYVMKGDAVEVVPAANGLANLPGHFWLARFIGPKKWTIGLLKKDELTCSGAK